ncbi:MAG: peptide deformylase [bacterium]
MTIRDILRYPDPRLKTVSTKVDVFDEAFQQLVDDLEETRLAGPGAVGIAAPQTAWFQRVVIIDVSKTKKPVPNHGHLVLVNPEITQWDNYDIGREGCLSVPDYTGNVIRAKQIILSAQNRYGETQQYEMTDFEARAVQHEIDHLDGLVFLDRVVSRNTDIFRRKVYQKSKHRKKSKTS